jgi:hypothetical protein
LVTTEQETGAQHEKMTFVSWPLSDYLVIISTSAAIIKYCHLMPLRHALRILKKLIVYQKKPPGKERHVSTPENFMNFRATIEQSPRHSAY